MQSSQPNRQEVEAFNRDRVTIPTDLLVSLATGPLLLMVLLGPKAVLEFLQDLGEASEEVFRGDRLPVLDFPQNQAPSTSPAQDEVISTKL